MPKKLLAADDSVTIHKVIELILADEDFVITSVYNGKEAIKSLKNQTPDVVLADIEMPDIGGFELARHIRDNMGGKIIPVILMASAFDTVDDAEVTKCGAKGYIKKPFEAQELLNKISSVLGQPVKKAPAKPAAPRNVEIKSEKQNSSVSEFDIDALLSEGGKDRNTDTGDDLEEMDQKSAEDMLSEIDLNSLLEGVAVEQDMKIAETSFMDEAMLSGGAENNQEQDDMDLWAEALNEQKNVEDKKNNPDADIQASDLTDDGLDDLLKEPTDTDRIKNAPFEDKEDNEDLMIETSLIDDFAVEAAISEDKRLKNVSKDIEIEETPDTETVADISAILEETIETKKYPKFTPVGVIPNIGEHSTNIAGGMDPFLSKADLLNILQYGVNQKISEILSTLDNQAIVSVLKESFKEFISQSVEETSENFADMINTAVDNKINEMLNKINLENILNQVISSTIKGIFREFDNNIIKITKDLIEQNISAMLQEKLLPLKAEIQGIVWEKLPEMAENIIKKEIEMIKTDAIN
jgi:CheY-like chemotaxis protein